jgi:hypothetical protein
MSRKLFCSMFVMVLGVSFVAADEFTATITKVDGGKITYQKMKKGEKKGDAPVKDGDPVVIAVDSKATIAKGMGKKGKFEAGDKIEDGLKNEIFSKEKLGEKGVGARITTEGEGDKAKVTQILVLGGKKKKDAN